MLGNARITMNNFETLEPLLNRVNRCFDEFKELHATNHRFAFWHDVGVTGLGALATALIGISELSDSGLIQALLRGTVLFITASITVFAACGQFFRFKEREYEYRTALERLREIRMSLSANAEIDSTALSELEKAFEVAATLPGYETNVPIFNGSKLLKRRVFRVSVLIIVISILFVLLTCKPTSEQPSPECKSENKKEQPTS